VIYIARKVKCRTCSEKDEKSKMIRTEKGEYYHQGECYEKHLEHKAFIEKENEEWDALYQYVKELHGLVVVPKAIVVRLQALRNGEDVRRGKKIKRYKMGAEYSLMLEAYLLAEKDIKWAIVNRLDNKNDVQAINYCISIMINKLNQAWKNRQKKKEAKYENKRIEKQIEEMSEVAKRVREIQSGLSTNTQNDSDIDITTLLD
jgi:hypothetical protein